MVSSVPSRLGEHPGEATLLHGKAVKARSTTSKNKSEWLSLSTHVRNTKVHVRVAALIAGPSNRSPDVPCYNASKSLALL